MSKTMINIDAAVFIQILKTIIHLCEKAIFNLEKMLIEKGLMEKERRINGPNRRAWMGRRDGDE